MTRWAGLGRRPTQAALAVLVLVSIGVLNAWQCVRLAPVDSDFVQCVLVARAILAGNVLLHGWVLASDNFLFTDVPGALAGFVFFSEWRHALLLWPVVTYGLIMLSGLLLVLRSGLRGDGRIVAAGLVVALLFTPDIHSLGGFLAVPAQHAASILDVLILLLIIQSGQRAASLPFVLGFWAISTLLLFSDPFAVVFFFAPLALVLVVQLAGGTDRRLPGRLLGATIAAGSIAMVSKPLILACGGFETAPAFTTQLVGFAGLRANLVTIASDVTTLAGAAPHDLGVAARLFQSLALIGAVIAIVASLRGASLTTGGIELLLALCVVSDVAGCLVSEQYHRSTLPGVTYNADQKRYLTPAIVFGWLLVSLWTGRVVCAVPERTVRAALAAALVVAGGVRFSAATVAALETRALPAAIASEPQARLAAWLSAHRLTHGVGSYWEASAVTVLSNGGVRVRAVLGIDGRLLPFRWIADDGWYRGPPPQFVVFARGDWFRIDERSIAATYGAPASVTDVDGFVVARLPGAPTVALSRDGSGAAP